MANNPRFEAHVTIPANEQMFVDIGGGNVQVDLTAAVYAPTALLAHLEARLEADTGAGFAVSMDPLTGQVTIAKDAGTFTLEWDTDEQRDLYGFAGDLTPAAASFTGTKGMQGVLIPNSPLAGDDLDLEIIGHERTDAMHVRGPTGKLWTFSSSSYYSFRNVSIQMVERARALGGASSSLNSWQAWVSGSLLGGLPPYFPMTGYQTPPVTVYADTIAGTLIGAAAGGDGIYRLAFAADLAPARATRAWNGLWAVAIPEMVKV